MTDRCEPPEELRGVDGWHWVQLPFVAVPTPIAWMRNPDNQEREWRMPSSPAFVSGESKTAQTWRYLSPVLTPAEADALRADNKRLREAINHTINVLHHGESTATLDGQTVRQYAEHLLRVALESPTA